MAAQHAATVDGKQREKISGFFCETLLTWGQSAGQRAKIAVGKFKPSRGSNWNRNSRSYHRSQRKDENKQTLMSSQKRRKKTSGNN
jgi:hypothetical protein